MGNYIDEFIEKTNDVPFAGKVSMGYLKEIQTQNGPKLIPQHSETFVLPEEAKKVIGDVSELEIMLPYNTLKENIEIKLERRKSKVICSGNGEVAFDKEQNQQVKCPCQFLGNGCQEIGIFKFYLRDIGDLGYYMMTCRGKTLQNIISFLKKTEERFKGLTGVVLFLKMKVIESSKNIGGKNTKINYPIAHLEYNRGQIEYLSKVMKEALQNQIKERHALLLGNQSKQIENKQNNIQQKEETKELPLVEEKPEKPNDEMVTEVFQGEDVTDSFPQEDSNWENYEKF